VKIFGIIYNPACFPRIWNSSGMLGKVIAQNAGSFCAQSHVFIPCNLIYCLFSLGTAGDVGLAFPAERTT